MAIETKTMDDIRKFAEHKIMGMPPTVFIIIVLTLIVAVTCKIVFKMSDIIIYCIVIGGISGGYIISKNNFMQMFFVPKLYRYVSHTNMRNLKNLYRRVENENSKKKQ